MSSDDHDDSDEYDEYDVYEGMPPPENVERLAAGLRAAADAIQAEIGGLYDRQNVSALRSVAHHAGRAAEIAGRIARFATDPGVGWQDVWRDGKYDPEWETEAWVPPDSTPPDEEGEETPLDA